jgi:hypothetical protein
MMIVKLCVCHWGQTVVGTCHASSWPFKMSLGIQSDQASYISGTQVTVLHFTYSIRLHLAHCTTISIGVSKTKSEKANTSQCPRYWPSPGSVEISQSSCKETRQLLCVPGAGPMNSSISTSWASVENAGWRSGAVRRVWKESEEGSVPNFARGLAAIWALASGGPVSKDCIREFTFENRGLMVVVASCRKNGTGGIVWLTKQ